MLSIEKVDTIAGFRELRPDWQKLTENTKASSIFMTHEWQYAWWQAYGHENSLYILAVRENETTLSIAPLMISGGRRPRIQFIGTPNADYCGFIGETSETVLRLLCDYIIKDRAWRKIDLTQIPEGSKILERLAGILTLAKIPYRAKEIETCYYYKFPGVSSAHADFSVKKNRKLKRAERYFGGEENLSLKVLDSAADILRILPTFYNFHINRWQDTSTPSKFLSPVNRRFYEALVESLGPLGRIRLLCLYHGQRPVAFCLGYLYENVLSLYGIAYDLYHARGSPGHLLLTYIVETFIRQGYLIDLSRGADSYKTTMANGSIKNYQFEIYRHNRQYRIAETIDRLKNSRIARVILDNPYFKELKDKLTINYQRMGPKTFFKKLADRAFRYFINYNVVKIYVQDGDPGIDDKPKIEIEVKRLTMEDLPLICSYYGIDSDSPKYQRLVDRFKRNSRCHVAYHRGSFATIFWTLCHEDPDPYTGFVLVPGEKQVIISDGFTSPIYQGNRIMPYLIDQALKDYYKDNYQVLAAVMKANYPMIKILDRYKYRYVRSVRTLKILGRKIL